jgi:hypothetical protein
MLALNFYNYHSDLWYNRSAIVSSKEGLEDIDAALMINPNQPIFIKRKFKLLLIEDRIEEALELLDLAVDPGNDLPHREIFYKHKYLWSDTSEKGYWEQKMLENPTGKVFCFYIN